MRSKLSSMHFSFFKITGLALLLILGGCGGSSGSVSGGTIRVDVANTGDTVSTEAPLELIEGETLQLEANVVIDGEKQDLTAASTWVSNNETVATVNGGLLRARNPGGANITAQYQDQTFSFNLIVKNQPCRPTGIAINGPSSLLVNQSGSFTAALICADGNTQASSFQWASSDASILSINPELGVATAHKAGSATISVSAENLNKTATVTVLGDGELFIDFPGHGANDEICPQDQLRMTVRNGNTGEVITPQVSITFNRNGVMSWDVTQSQLTAEAKGSVTINAEYVSGGVTSYGSASLTVSSCKPIEPPFDGLILQAESDEWNAISAHIWTNNGGNDEVLTGPWPGQQMTDIGGGVYEYRLPGVYAANIVFNNGNGGGSNQTEDLLAISSSQKCTVIDGGQDGKKRCMWTPIGEPSLSVDVSPSGGRYSQGMTVDIDWGNADIQSCLYTTDGSDPMLSGKSCLASGSVTLSQALPEGQSVVLRVCVESNETVNPECSSHTYRNAATGAFDWNNATVYFVITDRFLDGNPSNNNSYEGRPVDRNGIGTWHGGDIKGLTNKLNEGYFEQLGVSAIWITAPYEQIHGWVVGDSNSFKHYAYHGYYPLDYTVMDKNIGTDAEFREFVNTAHSQGVRVVMDIVMNHPGYGTIPDLNAYGVDVLKPGWENYDSQPIGSYHDNFDYDSNNWSQWWGSDWVRAGLPGYEKANCSVDQCPIEYSLNDLPDFKTNSNQSVGLPPFLTRKSDTRAVNLPNTPVKGYLIKWLSDWVREYGIDGFRADTVKHVEPEVWNELKVQASQAYEEWKQNIGGSPFSDDTSFWMTGEFWGHPTSNNAPNGHRFQNSGFDSMINFDFQGSASGAAYNIRNIDGVYSNLQNVRDNGLGLLNYLSSHDTSMFFNGDANRQKAAGSLLIMAPGPVQIYYGDESGREFGATGADPFQGTRSNMNWGALNNDILSHWRKLGQFRRSHSAIGAGSHQKLADSPYTFSRSYGSDKVIVVLGADANQSVTVNVGNVFSNGTELTDAYTGAVSTVSNGQVTFRTDSNGTLLIEE